jgi:hypothetical protein
MGHRFFLIYSGPADAAFDYRCHLGTRAEGYSQAPAAGACPPGSCLSPADWTMTFLGQAAFTRRSLKCSTAGPCRDRCTHEPRDISMLVVVYRRGIGVVSKKTDIALFDRSYLERLDADPVRRLKLSLWPFYTLGLLSLREIAANGASCSVQTGLPHEKT